MHELFQIANQPDELIAHIVMPLAGGTGGAKSDRRKSVHSILASMLLEHGIPLADVPNSVQTLHSSFGLHKLTHALFLSHDDEKLAQFREMCRLSHLPIHDVSTDRKQVQHKFQKIAAKKNPPRTYQNIDPSQYTLVPGFFKTKMGEPLAINQTFSPCVPGVTMMKPQDAEPWLVVHNKVIPDESAIFLIGQPPVTCQATRIVAPALNSTQQTCLLAGYLVQMGEKEVICNEEDEATIQCHEVQVCSITMWAKDWSPERWKEIQSAPVKQAKQILEADGVQASMQTPYGRTFHRDEAPCAPHESTSIQFHCEVKVTALRSLLRHSGFNGVYVVPKGQDGRPCQNWRIVWVDLPIKRLETVAMTHPGTAGLVRGRRTPGIRCEQMQFPEIWKLFHGDSPAPEQTPEGDLYKVQNLPYGVDKDVLEKWLSSTGWSAFPLKSIGARAWILKAASAPQTEVMSFNTQPVIIRRMKQKPLEATGLIVGPRSAKPAAIDSGTKTGGNPFKTGDPYYDPWKQPTANATTSPAGATSSTSQAPVQPGPTMAHLTKHDQQIAALESALQQVQTVQKDSTAKIETRITSVEAAVAQQTASTQSMFNDFRKEFHQSFQESVNKQDRKMQSTLEEIKALFHRTDKRKEPCSDDDDM
eukprot:Skav214258  [mRNA]  locus=scaffold2045:510766:512697:- [translate_table: standard]